MPGVSRYEDLVCWQLAHDLEREVFALTETGPASRDFKFRDQIRDSSSSATRNIAEGFGRYWPPEFSHFMIIARGSLMETDNSVRAGLNRGYFTREQAECLQLLARRAGKASTGLIRYLESCREHPRSLNRPNPRTP
jgi:four helix bundle protein